jgi:ABC-type oligopeptide transport system substrate-binding subunit
MLDIKKRFVSLALAGSLLGVSAVGVAAAPPTQAGGAAGVVAAVVQAIDTVDVNNGVINVEVVDINNSFNNLTALNNVLNNSPILSGNDVDVTVIDGDVTVENVLNGAQLNVLNIAILNGLDVDIDDVVAVVELLSGDFILITR